MNHSFPAVVGVEAAPEAVRGAAAGASEDAFAFASTSGAGFGFGAGGAEQEMMTANAKSERFKRTSLLKGKTISFLFDSRLNSLILRGLDFRPKTLIIRGLYVRHRPLRRETAEGHRG
jgi:hypothetical protein